MIALPIQSPRARLFAAAGLSLAVNGALVVGLASVQSASAEVAEPTPARVPLSVLEEPPPPPPPPRAPDPAEPVSLEASPKAALPPLDLPPIAAAAGGIPMPESDPSLYDFDVALEMPSYAGRGEAPEMGASEGTAFEPPGLLYPPDLTQFYPRIAKQTRTQGRSTLRLRVDARGEVRSAEVVSSDPPGVFDAAAQRAALRLRYKPALRNGRPQAATVTLVLTWTLDD